ncbi:hypothetical protein VCRA2123O444_320043 [Vibrio crassostreae]|nr:hypothetical protein VCRA2118O429_250007 [Vibrio crassostreae]CAK1939800.1 hypothetical protein VCRA2113O412_260007 [Vibrio crassostreae]CAK1940577.1 hypothetical protein VCRA2113O413_260007 [Vibrio crassostreae]CAK1945529.1 hypothetical protein VCRA2119O432_260066 [Vibrio crassostreae]CAK1946618.1 hypothetical protein VCRA2114O423_260065 [Vibrio crassostreae]
MVFLKALLTTLRIKPTFENINLTIKTLATEKEFHYLKENTEPTKNHYVSNLYS